MSVILLALRERARRWLRIQAVKIGARCLHTVAPSLWRPVAVGLHAHPNARLNVGVWSGALPMPGRFCEQCDVVEVLTEGEYYGFFGSDFNERARVGA